MPGYHDIRAELGGDDAPPWFVIHQGTTILALTLREDLNPNIGNEPAEVWVGAEHPLPAWGDRLAHDTGEVLLYVARTTGNPYELRGRYRVLPREHTAQELKDAQQFVPHALSRIVFLSGPHPA